jgi:hypothetical protein
MDIDETKRLLGVYLQPGFGNATGYPGLRDTIGAIWRQRVASVPWIPQQWLGDVLKLERENPNDVVRPAPAIVGGLVIPSAPVFLAGDRDRAEWWQAMVDQVNLAITQWAAGQAAAGKSELDRLYRNATFWDRAYRFTKAIADAPKNIATATLDAAGSVTGGVAIALLKSPLVWITAAVVGLVLWRSPGAALLRQVRGRG